MLACTAGRVHTLPEHDGTVAPCILHRRAISPSLLFFSSLGYLGLFLAEWPAYRVIWQHPQQPFTGPVGAVEGLVDQKPASTSVGRSKVRMCLSLCFTCRSYSSLLIAKLIAIPKRKVPSARRPQKW